MDQKDLEEMERDSTNLRIINIRRNKRTGNIHATLVNENGELLISATLEYIQTALYERMPKI